MNFRNNGLLSYSVTNTNGGQNTPAVSLAFILGVILQIIILSSLCAVLPNIIIDFSKTVFSTRISRLVFAFLICFECIAASFLCEQLLLLFSAFLHLFKCVSPKPFKILFVFYVLFCVLYRMLFAVTVWLLIAAGGISWYMQGYTHPINYIFLCFFAAATVPLIVGAVKIVRSKGANLKGYKYF